MELKEGKTIDKYRLLRKLGSGGFSEVWLAEKRQVNSLNVALKIYYSNSTTQEERERFIRKFEMVFNLRHTNLLPYNDCIEDSGMLYFVMPWCRLGSVAAQAGHFPETDAWHFLADVASGLAYLHQKNIIHQDIKPDNVLISDDNTYLITDFDISVKARNTRRIGDETPAGTAGYMAPERFGTLSDPIQASDIWGLGASLVELLTGNLPFGENGGLYQKSGAPMPTLNHSISRPLQNIITLCLQQEPWNRPTAKEITEWCTEFSQNGKIQFNPKYRKILGNISLGENLTGSIKKSKKDMDVLVIVILFALSIVTIGYIMQYGKEMKIEKSEQRELESAQSEKRRQQEIDTQIKNLLVQAGAAFNRQNRDYNEAFRLYLEAKKLGSTDTTGYTAFLRTAKALIEGNEGEYDEFICHLLHQAQQLQNTSEIQTMLKNCGNN